MHGRGEVNEQMVEVEQSKKRQNVQVVWLIGVVENTGCTVMGTV